LGEYTLLKVIKKTDEILAYISSFALFSMMILIFINAISRYFLTKPLSGVIEFTGEYLMVIMVFLAMSFTQKNDGHVKVELLQKFLPEKLKIVIEVLVKILSASIFILLTYTSYLLFVRNLNQDIRSISTLAYPLAPAVFLISFGSLVMSLRLLLSIFTSDSKGNENKEVDPR
jgi:TRAP-type transport system small permease protein